ncbi:MAG: tRNA adenosine(34) deaminase TadA [Proteobacteria bacterium]|nr:MAG: tRNA adenosine(34) deaminase TadA [Pseudomonadota bacterium]
MTPPELAQPSDQDEVWMLHAQHLAERAEAQGEVPVGAVLVSSDNTLISEGWNQPIAHHDPSAHAEIMALRAAGEKLENYRLPGTTLYVTLEPCVMCAGAMLHARVSRVVFGAYDPKTGATGSVYNTLQDDKNLHKLTVRGGVLAEQCGEQLSAFFRRRRKQSNKC